jgi:hypothetical protein
VRPLKVIINPVFSRRKRRSDDRSRCNSQSNRQ